MYDNKQKQKTKTKKHSVFFLWEEMPKVFSHNNWWCQLLSNINKCIFFFHRNIITSFPLLKIKVEYALPDNY